MGSRRTITVVGCHAGGEVGNVVVAGVEPPPGDTVFEQMQALAADDSLRRFLLREPHGSVATHANLIVPATREDCAAGYIIMEPTEYPAMSGSNTICVATVLLETGRVAMHEPETTLRLEAPAGVVEIRARCRDGRVESVELTNVPAFATHLSVPLDVQIAEPWQGVGRVTKNAVVIAPGRLDRSATGTGIAELYLDPDDPFPEGYLLSDTWPGDDVQ
jgi:proline racemase